MDKKDREDLSLYLTSIVAVATGVAATSSYITRTVAERDCSQRMQTIAEDCQEDYHEQVRQNANIRLSLEGCISERGAPHFFDCCMEVQDNARLCISATELNYPDQSIDHE